MTDKVAAHQFKYEAMPLEKRREILPERSVCSLYPAEGLTHAFFTGNGKQSMNILGDPYEEIIPFGHEALYEPMWARAPEPPDLTGVMPQMRKLMLEGLFDDAAELIEKTQLDAGFGPLMVTTNVGAIIPPSSLRLHYAFQLKIKQPKISETKDYLRWLDMLTGCVTIQWENALGKFMRKSVVSYKGDVCAICFTPPNAGELDVEVEIIPPVGGKGLVSGWYSNLKYPGRCTQKLSVDEKSAAVELAYYPEYGQKGYCSAMRFIKDGGKAEVADG